MNRSVAERVYHAVLHLYPPAFYRQFAGDMLMDFRESYRAPQARDPRRLASYVVGAFVDLTASVVMQWSRADCVRTAMRMALGNVGLWAITLWFAWREWPRGPITATSLMQMTLFVAVMTMVIVTAITVGMGRRPCRSHCTIAASDRGREAQRPHVADPVIESPKS